MNISFKQLKLFVTLVQAGNLAEAAERLCITKAAASLSLRELEKQLDCRLFDRVRNRLQLNTQGNGMDSSPLTASKCQTGSVKQQSTEERSPP